MFSFPERLDGVLNIVSLRMYTYRGNPLFSFRCVQLKLTKLFIHVDICFMFLPVQKKREKGENDFGEMQMSSL